MTIVIECFKPKAECRDFLYTLYVNDIFICSLHNLDLIKIHLRKHFDKFREK